MKVDGNNSLRGQRSQLVDNEASEIEGLKSYYKNQKEIARTGHEQELASVQEAQKKELIETIDQHQDRLNEKLEEYKNQELELEKSRQALIEANKEELKNIRAEFQQNRDSQFDETLDQTEDLRRRSDQIMKKTQLDAAKALSEGQRYFGLALDEQARAHGASLRQNDSRFKQSESTKEAQRIRELNNEAQQNAKEFASESARSKTQLESQKQLYGKQMETEKLRFEDLLKQQKENFQNRYDALKEANDLLLGKMSSQISKEYNSMNASMVNNKEVIQAKAADPFYHPTAIQPQIEDAGKFYLVRIEVPEHERELVTLNANQRTLKINLTRKTGQTFEAPDGSINKSSRSELLSKELSVADIVDPRSIKQKYENGMLTFQVAKA